MRTYIIIFFIYCLYFPYAALATKEDDCSSRFAPLKLIKNKDSNPTAQINYPKNPHNKDPFQNFPPDLRLQLIKSALRIEAGVNLTAESRRAKSPEEFVEAQRPFGFKGNELVNQYGIIFNWIINELSYLDQKEKHRILRALYKSIFREKPNINIIFPNFPSPVVKQHFDSILHFLLQYKRTGSLSISNFFNAPTLEQMTSREKAEHRIQIVNQLFYQEPEKAS